MFLSRLSKKEKEAFISLSVHASNSNDVFADEEKLMIQGYCKEMDIPSWNIEDTISMDEIVDICQLVWLTKNTSYENVGGIFLRKNTIDS